MKEEEEEEEEEEAGEFRFLRVSFSIGLTKEVWKSLQTVFFYLFSFNFTFPISTFLSVL